MILFRATKQSQSAHREIDILIYALTEHDAIEYLKKIPLFWNESFVTSDFKEVQPPAGPSPSIFMYERGNTISAD